MGGGGRQGDQKRPCMSLKEEREGTGECELEQGEKEVTETAGMGGREHTLEQGRESTHESTGERESTH